MPRKRRDEETVLAHLKQFARDKNCPWSIRVWCVYALGLATKMFPAVMPPPGTARYKEQSNAAAPPEPPVQEEKTVQETVSGFLERLKSGGDDALSS